MIDSPFVLLFRPRCISRQDRELAEGIRAVWACALFASGGTMALPSQGFNEEYGPTDTAPDVSRAMRDVYTGHGRILARDPAISPTEPDAVVRTQFIRGADALRITLRIDRAHARPIVRSGQSFGGSTRELRAMSATLEAIAQALVLGIPSGIGWRELTSSQTPMQGRSHLLATGREALGLHPCPPVLH